MFFCFFGLLSVNSPNQYLGVIFLRRFSAFSNASQLCWMRAVEVFIRSGSEIHTYNFMRLGGIENESNNCNARKSTHVFYRLAIQGKSTQGLAEVRLPRYRTVNFLFTKKIKGFNLVMYIYIYISENYFFLLQNELNQFNTLVSVL